MDNFESIKKEIQEEIDKKIYEDLRLAYYCELERLKFKSKDSLNDLLVYIKFLKDHKVLEEDQEKNSK